MKAILFCLTLLCISSAFAQQDPSSDLLGYYNGASGGIVGGPIVSIGRPDPFFDALLAQAIRPRGLGTTITQDTYTTPSLLSIITGSNGTVTSTVTKIYPTGQYPIYPNPFFALPPSR